MVLLGSVACTGGTGQPAPGTSAPIPPSAMSTATRPAPTTSAAPAFTLPATCSALLTLGQLDEALGVRLPGTTTYVVGAAEPGIGRTGRVTCGYGVTPATDTAGVSDPLLEISVFTYEDRQAAADRVAVLLETQQAQGVRSGPATVPGADAVLLTGSADTTLVVTVQARTYALTLVPGLLDEAATRTALEQLAGVALAAGNPVQD